MAGPVALAVVGLDLGDHPATGPRGVARTRNFPSSPRASATVFFERSALALIIRAMRLDMGPSYLFIA